VVYPAKQDWWVACLVVPSGVGLVGLGAFAAYQTAMQGIPPSPGLILAAVMPVVGGLMLWMFCATSYEIAESDLITRLGPFRWRAPLDAIEKVVSTKGFRLIVGLGLAWSLDMLHVKYRKRNGRMAFPVSISPRDKAGFLRELAAAAPGLKVAGDGPDQVPPG
jgi:Bacterial PH domain